MKGLILAGLALLLLALAGSSVAARQTDQSSGKETAVIEFTDKTRLGEVVLLGKYLFEHDDSRMARGEPCMCVYEYTGGKAGKLLVSFHCKPVERAKARDVVVSLAMTSNPEVFELKEVQFRGSTKGHVVP